MYVPRATRIFVVLMLANKSERDVGGIFVVESIKGDASLISPIISVTLSKLLVLPLTLRNRLSLVPFLMILDCRLKLMEF
jgi:hypothetical protein